MACACNSRKRVGARAKSKGIDIMKPLVTVLGVGSGMVLADVAETQVVKKFPEVDVKLIHGGQVALGVAGILGSMRIKDNMVADLVLSASAGMGGRGALNLAKDFNMPGVSGRNYRKTFAVMRGVQTPDPTGGAMRLNGVRGVATPDATGGAERLNGRFEYAAAV